MVRGNKEFRDYLVNIIKTYGKKEILTYADSIEDYDKAQNKEGYLSYTKSIELLESIDYDNLKVVDIVDHQVITGSTTDYLYYMSLGALNEGYIPMIFESEKGRNLSEIDYMLTFLKFK